MFWSSPSFDLQVTVILIVVATIIAIITGLLKKNFFLAMIVFSVLTDLAFVAAIVVGSTMYNFYGIRWLMWISITAWPVLNFFLIAKYREK